MSGKPGVTRTGEFHYSFEGVDPEDLRWALAGAFFIQEVIAGLKDRGYEIPDAP